MADDEDVASAAVATATERQRKATMIRIGHSLARSI